MELSNQVCAILLFLFQTSRLINASLDSPDSQYTVGVFVSHKDRDALQQTRHSTLSHQNLDGSYTKISPTRKEEKILLCFVVPPKCKQINHLGWQSNETYHPTNHRKC